MAVPWEGIGVRRPGLERYILHAPQRAARASRPVRGVTAETCFVGAGMRKHPACPMCPAGSRWCRCCSSESFPLTWSSCTARRHATGCSVWASRSTSCRRRSRAADGVRAGSSRSSTTRCLHLRRRPDPRVDHRPRHRGLPAVADACAVDPRRGLDDDRPARCRAGRRRSTLQMGIGGVCRTRPSRPRPGARGCGCGPRCSPMASWTWTGSALDPITR